MRETRIRRGKIKELHVLQKIEISAGKVFADYDTADIASNAPPSISTLNECCRQEKLSVHTDASDYPIAYMITEVVDGSVHIEPVSVHANHSANGIGKALIEYLLGCAKNEDFTAVTLTTFADLRWNAPY